MLLFILAVFLALLTLASISLQKAYTHISFKELKRRARAGDDFAGVLHKAVAYGGSVQILLWTIIGLSAAGFFVIVARTLPAWLAIIVSIVLIWLGFAWLPRARLSIVSKTAVRFLTTPLAWLVGIIYPILNFVERATSHRTPKAHTGLYQKEDLLSLLEAQKTQQDNRITADELRITKGSLTFGDKIVRDVMTPKREVKAVATTDSIGPLLMDELHASGHSRFPVYQDKTDNFVGMLYARDLMASHNGGHVRDVMKKQVYYVHEEQSLRQVLSAFLKTKHHLFIVVNAFEEIVGIITIEDILEQILGKPIVDEFDKYDDMRAVAALKAKAEHQNQVPEETKTKEKEEESKAAS